MEPIRPSPYANRTKLLIKLELTRPTESLYNQFIQVQEQIHADLNLRITLMDKIRILEDACKKVTELRRANFPVELMIKILKDSYSLSEYSDAEIFFNRIVDSNYNCSTLIRPYVQRYEVLMEQIRDNQERRTGLVNTMNERASSPNLQRGKIFRDLIKNKFRERRVKSQFLNDIGYIYYEDVDNPNNII